MTVPIPPRPLASRVSSFILCHPPPPSYLVVAVQADPTGRLREHLPADSMEARPGSHVQSPSTSRRTTRRSPGGTDPGPSCSAVAVAVSSAQISLMVAMSASRTYSSSPPCRDGWTLIATIMSTSCLLLRHWGHRKTAIRHFQVSATMSAVHRGKTLRFVRETTPKRPKQASHPWRDRNVRLVGMAAPGLARWATLPLSLAGPSPARLERQHHYEQSQPKHR